MDEMDKKTFHWVDYVVFTLVLVVSLGIGIYHAFSGGRQKTTQEYLLANRNLGAVPVAMSMLVSVVSAMSIIGFPAEVYYWGAQFWVGSIGQIFGTLMAAFVVAPTFYPLKFTSIYEYLIARFGSLRLKQLACIFSIGGGLCFMGSVLYLPAAAVEASSDIPLWLSLVVAGGIATIYTTLGGMKAVIWTDVFQTFVIFAGFIAIFIQGVIKVGGLGRIWEINRQGNRLNLIDLNPDPTKRMNFWGLTIGNSVMYVYMYGFSQNAVQRYSAVKTLQGARRSILLTIPPHFLINTLAVWIGMTVYAFYYIKGCDPMKDGRMSNPNQIIPYFVINNLNFPGFPGLFTSCIWAGSLSSMSSMLAGMATNLWADIISPWFVNATEFKKTVITKILVFILGILCIGAAFLIGSLGGLIWQAALTISSVTFSPFLTIFLLGLCFPFANLKGAVASALTAMVVCLWIAAGSITIEKHLEKLPVPDHNCTGLLQNGANVNNTMESTGYLMTTLSSSPGALEEHAGGDQLSSFFTWIYSISFLWIKFAGMLVGLSVGIVVSLITGRNKSADSRLVLKPAARLFCMHGPEISQDLPESKPLNNGEKGIELVQDLYISSAKIED